MINRYDTLLPFRGYGHRDKFYQVKHYIVTTDSHRAHLVDMAEAPNFQVTEDQNVEKVLWGIMEDIKPVFPQVFIDVLPTISMLEEKYKREPVRICDRKCDECDGDGMVYCGHCDHEYECENCEDGWIMKHGTEMRFPDNCTV